MQVKKLCQEHIDNILDSSESTEKYRVSQNLYNNSTQHIMTKIS